MTLIRAIRHATCHPVAGFTALIVVAIGDSLAAVAFWNLREIEVGRFGLLWPLMFAVAGAACAVLMCAPSWIPAFWLSGSLSSLAAASRVLGVIARYQSGQADGWHSIVELDIYLLLAVVVFIAWLTAVEPWRAQSVADRGGT